MAEESRNQTSTLNFGDTKIRYGLLDRLDVNFAGAYAGYSSDGNSEFGLINYQFNLRYLIFPGKGGFPAIGLEAGATRSRGSVFPPFDEVEARAVLSLSSAVTDNLAITVNAIVPDPDNLAFTANVAYAVNEKFGVLAEYYPNLIRRQTFENTLNFDVSYINIGAYYNLSRNFQFDIAGFWLNDSGDEVSSQGELKGYQFQIGLTFRTHWR
ncbi:MAG: hypothetical protein ABR574_09100 [Cryomorphaceae bacterium]|nr:hypothetical protein [Flavobacteriales bacterium]